MQKQIKDRTEPYKFKGLHFFKPEEIKKVGTDKMAKVSGIITAQLRDLKGETFSDEEIEVALNMLSK